MLADRQCDAIILYTRHMSEKAIMSLINSIAMPLVVINRDVAQARERCVFFEQQEAAFRGRGVSDYPRATAISPASPSRCIPPTGRGSPAGLPQRADKTWY